MEAPPGIFLARPEQPAEGIRLAVKDLFDTAGLTTTYGSAIFFDHVPRETAEVVLRLEAAGYANVGKTNLHEFAYGTTSENPHFGTVPNPIAPGRVAGGSSGGSAAAVAAGLADAALGSDTGGSIRIPAACCGVVGFKPTWGLVPLEGCFPLAPSLDHGGPMAPSVEGCTAMLEALVPGFERATLDALADVRIGAAWTEQAEPHVRAGLTLLTWPFNVLGAPALALPCGSAEDGLPASVQVAGPPGADALVLAAGALLEQALKP